MASRFPSALKAVLASRKVSMLELMRRTGLPKSTMSMVTNGKRRVTMKTLVRIITALSPTKAETRSLIAAAMADHQAEELVAMMG